MKKLLLKTILFFTLLSNLSAIELTFSANPDLLLPGYTNDTLRFEKTAFGGFVNAGVNLFDFMNVGVQGGYFMLNKMNSAILDPSVDTTVNMVPIGAQVGFYYYPLARLQLYAGASAGACFMNYGNERLQAPYYNFLVQTGYRITPSVLVGLNGSYMAVQNDSWIGNPGMKGFSVGLEAKFTLDTNKEKSKIHNNVEIYDSIFPAMHSIYLENALGSIQIRNNESAPIKNVKVTFESHGYTNSAIECGSVEKFKRYEKIEFPIYADFNDNIQQFVEEGKIPGVVIVDYELLGQKRKAQIPVSIPVHNINQVSWVDPSNLCCFVTSTDENALSYAKYCVGIGRMKSKPGLNKNLQFTAYLLEGLRLFGIDYVPDAETPYSTSHLNYDELDTIQHAYQTLEYRSGDVDEIGIAFMSMLEGVGIPVAYIPCNDDFVVAVDLGLHEKSLNTLFASDEDAIIVDEKVYLPLSMKNLNKGFTESWKKGAAVYKQQMEEDGIDFIIVEDSWGYYPPAAFKADKKLDLTYRPSAEQLDKAALNEIDKYIALEFEPQITAVSAQIKAEGNKPDLLNKLGMLYVRAGQYNNAKTTFEKAAGLGSISAMLNRANVATIQNDSATAKVWYEKVLAKDSNNQAAKKALDKINAQ